MKELVVISGKGGTGKTSVVGSLAALAKNKVLVDCDVDAADLHLLLRPNIRETHDFSSSSLAFINDDKCTGCGVCLDYCRFDAILHESVGDRERFWIDKFACEGCGACPHFCPEQAIDFHKIINGKWFISDSPYGPMVHARLGVAQGNSGKLVAHLRQQAKAIAAAKGCDLIIVDGPPGIGCPVISSITGANYLLIVTEPSMSAFHDMERLLQLARNFSVAVGLCINKYDINMDLTGQIERFANEKHIPIIGKIAYDQATTRAQLAETTIVEYDNGPLADSLKKLWDNLEKELANASGRTGQQIQSLNP